MKLNKINQVLTVLPTITFNKRAMSKIFNDPKVRTSEKLDFNDLSDLFEGKILALRIPEFCPKQVCDQVLKNLQDREVVDYANAKGVGKFKDVGMAYFEAESPEKKRKYYEERINSFQKVREIFSPYLSPIDKVRVELGEIWPYGASLLHLGKEPMFVGLLRALTGEILPHEDKLYRDDPSSIVKIKYVSQIAFNCYLHVPKKGGELELWDKSLSDREYDTLRGESYGISRSLLPPKVCTIKPNDGEFIAFNACNLHAVCAQIGNSLLNNEMPRVSASGFVIYQGDKLPLKLMS